MGRVADHHAEERTSTRQLKSTYTPVDASDRPVSGHATAQRAEERTAMKKELSSLQLMTNKDLQSTTVTSQQQESRMETETSPEEEQRGKSPLPSLSARELAEQHERHTASQETEIETLRKLAKDLDRRLMQQSQSTVRSNDLASGFYPTPYVERGRPITPGVATGPEVQQPEVRLNSLPVGYGNAYGIFPNGPSFYSPPGYSQYAYFNGVQNTPYPEVYRHSRPDNAYGAYPNCVIQPSQGAEMRQVYQILPEQQQTNDFHQQQEVERRQATERPVVQFCDGTTPENTVTRPGSRVQQNSSMIEISAHQTLEGRATELETDGTVYHTTQTRREDSSYRKEPSTKPELRTKERKVLLYESEDSTDEDAPEIRRHRKKKAETDAEVSTTQHSLPRKSTSSSQNGRRRTSSRTSSDRRRSSTSEPRSMSTEDRNWKSPRAARRATTGSESNNWLG